VRSHPSDPIPIFRSSGAYWGFVEADRLYDHYGRQMGWLDPGPDRLPDVFDLGGRFLGELVDHRYVLRNALRAEPVPRAPRPPRRHPAPPDEWPDREARDLPQDWGDALPWPLAPPDPPAR
jgi:hypothetical protein